MLDPSAQIEQLKAYIENLGNTTTANYLSSKNILAQTPTNKTPPPKDLEAAPSTISFNPMIDEDIMARLNKQ